MTIITGDCLEVMKTFPDNHFSCIVTDPPYGLSFMGKEWDHDIPGIDYWRSCFRIIKPGGFLLAMGGSRTSHRLTCAIEDSGFNIRDTIMWLYGSGFPKSHNHFGIEGYGTALKPAWEPIIVAMKPCEGTFKQNAEKWGQAGINIDGCRIPGQSWGSRPAIKLTSKGKSGGGFGQTQWESLPGFNEDKGKGRWPANVILDEEAGALLDEQTGSLLGSGNIRPMKQTKTSSIFLGTNNADGVNPNYHQNKGGGASRFFYCAKASSSERNEGLEGLPVGQSVGGGGTNNTEDDVCGKYGSIKAPQKNYHPTVKPLKLMEYLIKLVMPPKDGLLLDPFAGSGTTILAAKRLGFDAIGIEKSEEYSAIARARIEAHRDLFAG